MVKHGWEIRPINWIEIMNKPKLLFLCNFSNALIRDRVVLRESKLRSLYFRIKHIKPHYGTDYAVWVSDYIEEFENHPEWEFHIVAPMQGLRNETQCFEERGIHYHFYNCSYNFVKTIANKVFNYEEGRDYPTIRKRIRSIAESISPELVILCGAENPFYSIGVLDVKKQPVYVILQTLLNSPKRASMGVGNDYKRKIEKAIFAHANFFCTSDETEISVIKENNEHAVILPAGFPTHNPDVVIPEEKDFDFVFFAKTIGKYKGIEDVLQALAIVKKNKKDVRLIIIGGLSDVYKEVLNEQVHNLGIDNNVIFAGLYQEIGDTYSNVVKANAAVLPGVTGSFNSTVRESMLMGIPVICYEFQETINVNANKHCLLTAKMEDIDDLAKQMLFTIENCEETKHIAENGRDYALSHFGNAPIVNRLLKHCQAIVEGKYGR